MNDPDLLGHLYLGAYLMREPDYAFVLTSSGRPCGYIVGTRDTAAFHAWSEQHWLPVLRQQYGPEHEKEARSDFERRLMAALHRPAVLPDISQTHPAHLHINVTADAQGSGGGRALMEALLASLIRAAVPGVHLIMSATNTGALRFYQRLGFSLQAEDEHSLTLARTLAH